MISIDGITRFLLLSTTVQILRNAPKLAVQWRSFADPQSFAFGWRIMQDVLYFSAFSLQHGTSLTLFLTLFQSLCASGFFLVRESSSDNTRTGFSLRRVLVESKLSFVKMGDWRKL